MDVRLYLERKRLWCEQNSQDQKALGHMDNAQWWNGRAASYQDVIAALESGIVTPDGIAKLDLSAFTTS